MENMGVVDVGFWKDKKVFVTGHTGFKGSWLCLWLHSMGAIVTGYALKPPTEPSLFELSDLSSSVQSIIGDIRDRVSMKQALQKSEADIVIHMAAQPLVRYSYLNPIETYETNVMGTTYLLEAIRECVSEGQAIKAVLVVTTDKCYENQEWIWGYRENEPLGGFDPYSNSKACAELVVSAYRNSFFNEKQKGDSLVAVASARAGNVIGGGDWAEDRLIPDCIQSLLKGEQITIRNPNSIRPWQHVLEPISGYLLLAQKLYTNGLTYAEAWNFGPEDIDARPVEWLVQQMCSKWSKDASYKVDSAEHPHEAHYLKLDCSKAKSKLDWHPRWNLEQTIDNIIQWTHAYETGDNMKSVCLQQIDQYMTKK